MALQTFRLEIEGSSQGTGSLSALGITGCRVRHALRGVDVAVLTRPVGPGDGPVFAPGQKAVLREASGSVLFRGQIGHRSLEGREGRLVEEVRLLGPAEFLRQTTFAQPGWLFATAPEDFDGGTAGSAHSRVALGQAADGSKLPLAQQIAEILEAAIAAGAGIDYSLEGLPEVSPPVREFTGLSLAAAIDRCLDWLPHVVWFIDHAPVVPVVRFTTGGARRLWTGWQGDVTVLDARARADLLLQSLTLETIGTERRQVTAPGGEAVNRFWAVRQAQEADGAIDGGRRTVARYLHGGVYEQRFDEDLQAFVQETIAPSEAPPSANLAELMVSGFRQVYWEMRARRTGAAPSLVEKPGDWLALNGFNAGWALDGSELAMVHAVERELAEGTTTVEAGPPSQGGFAPLDRLARAQDETPGAANQRTTGEKSGWQASFGSEREPSTKVRIYGCADGQAVYYEFPPSVVNGPVAVE